MYENSGNKYCCVQPSPPPRAFLDFLLRGGDGCTQAIEVIDTEKNFQLIPYKLAF